MLLHKSIFWSVCFAQFLHRDEEKPNSMISKSGGYNQRFVTWKRKDKIACNRRLISGECNAVQLVPFFLFDSVNRKRDAVSEWVRTMLLNYLRIYTACVQFHPNGIPLIFQEVRCTFRDLFDVAFVRFLSLSLAFPFSSPNSFNRFIKYGECVWILTHSGT